MFRSRKQSPLPKRVDINDDAVITARGMGISFGDEYTPSRDASSAAGWGNHNAALSDGTGGALWLPSYLLRRDATALGLLLLSI